MARRSRRVLKKPVRVVKLDTAFTCPFCYHPESVACIIDKKLFLGEAKGCICEPSFATSITPLTEPIDIYSEWIDECASVNKS
uniref:Transcription elongation factor 1 homolog n=1 Tax=Manihot esculenta TaxID=3983 RepID=A0A2C9W8Q1_MANES